MPVYIVGHSQPSAFTTKWKNLASTFTAHTYNCFHAAQWQIKHTVSFLSEVSSSLKWEAKQGTWHSWDTIISVCCILWSKLSWISWFLLKVKKQSSLNSFRAQHTLPHLKFREQINKSCRFGQDLSHFAAVNHSRVKLQTTFVSPSAATLSWQHNIQQPHHRFWKGKTCAPLHCQTVPQPRSDTRWNCL